MLIINNFKINIQCIVFSCFTRLEYLKLLFSIKIYLPPGPSCKDVGNVKKVFTVEELLNHLENSDEDFDCSSGWVKTQEKEIQSTKIAFVHLMKITGHKIKLLIMVRYLELGPRKGNLQIMFTDIG